MCIIYAVKYACAHDEYIDEPLATACTKMAEVSTTLHPVYCPGDLPVAIFSSDNVCPDCARRCYLLEKRYQITTNVQAAGGKTREIPPLNPYQVRIWRVWRRDWEKFRAVGVRGGKGGELGQGWNSELVTTVTEGSGKTKGSVHVTTKMKGFPEIYNFDEFLGRIGPFELEGLPLGMLGAEMALIDLEKREASRKMELSRKETDEEGS